MDIEVSVKQEADVLTKAEARRFANLESKVERAVTAAGKIAGEALRTIRDERLYRLTHRSFEAYVMERWGFSRTTAYRMIGQAQPDTDLVPISAPETAKEQVNVYHSGTVEHDKESDDPRPTAPPAVEPDQSGRPADTRGTGSPDSGSATDGEAETAGDGRGDELADALTPQPTQVVNTPKNDTGPMPGKDALAAAVYMSMVEIEPEDAAKQYDDADADYIEDWTARLVAARRRLKGGQVKRPADRAKAKKLEPVADPLDPRQCEHKKESRQKLTWGTICGDCKKRVA